MRVSTILSLVWGGRAAASSAEKLPKLDSDRLKLGAISSKQEDLEPPQWVLPRSLSRYRMAGVIPPTLKIGLQVSQPAVSFALKAPVQVGNLSLQPGRTYEVVLRDSTLELQAPGDPTFKPVLLEAPLSLQASQPGSFLVGGARYRGNLEIVPSPTDSGMVTLINQVGLEDYLLGVVPVEMAPGWPGEALKSQAVAARTYAAANIGRRNTQGFDLYPTVSDQVYRGMGVEAVDTTAAVEATRGQVLTFNGTPINALFHSSSGGETDSAQEVWGMDLPYIQGVADIDASPNRHWTQRYSQDQVVTALKKLGVDVGTVQQLSSVLKTSHGRVRELEVRGTKGLVTVDANRFRLAIGLKSTRFAVFATSTGWQFEGGGYGHGLGMSQWGARSYAEKGESYDKILLRYYTGVQLTAVQPQT